MNHNKRIPNECTTSTISWVLFVCFKREKELHKIKQASKEL